MKGKVRSARDYYNDKNYDGTTLKGGSNPTLAATYTGLGGTETNPIVIEDLFDFIPIRICADNGYDESEYQVETVNSYSYASTYYYQFVADIDMNDYTEYINYFSDLPINNTIYKANGIISNSTSHQLIIFNKGKEIYGKDPVTHKNHSIRNITIINRYNSASWFFEMQSSNSPCNIYNLDFLNFIRFNTSACSIFSQNAFKYYYCNFTCYDYSRRMLLNYNLYSNNFLRTQCSFSSTFNYCTINIKMSAPTKYDIVKYRADYDRKTEYNHSDTNKNKNILFSYNTVDNNIYNFCHINIEFNHSTINLIPVGSTFNFSYITFKIHELYKDTYTKNFHLFDHLISTNSSDYLTYNYNKFISSYIYIKLIDNTEVCSDETFCLFAGKYDDITNSDTQYDTYSSETMITNLVQTPSFVCLDQSEAGTYKLSEDNLYPPLIDSDNVAGLKCWGTQLFYWLTPEQAKNKSVLEAIEFPCLSEGSE